MQQSFANAPPRLFQAPEGLWADHAVYEQPAVLLKLPHGCADGLVVTVAVRLRKQPDSEESGPHFGYGRTRGSQVVDMRVHSDSNAVQARGWVIEVGQARYGASSASSAPLGLAPTICLTTLPPW